MNKSLVLLLVFLTILIIGCSKQMEPNLNKEQARNYANELYNRRLFKQSAAEYERYLNAYKLKYLHPKEEIKKEVDKKIVACLERLERTEDAEQTLRESTSLEPEAIQKKRPGAVVARIGSREITQGDIDFELSQLPPSIRSQYNTKEKKLEFLNQYILTELLYKSAQNMELDKNAEVIEAAFQAKKSIMVQKYLQDQIRKEVKIKPEDVELYYKANKDKYVEKDKEGNVIREKPFDEVQQQAAQDLMVVRQQDVYKRMVERLMRAEGVQVYDDVLK